jgi:hypothetical protein
MRGGETLDEKITRLEGELADIKAQAAAAPADKVLRDKQTEITNALAAALGEQLKAYEAETAAAAAKKPGITRQQGSRDLLAGRRRRSRKTRRQSRRTR